MTAAQLQIESAVLAMVAFVVVLLVAFYASGDGVRVDTDAWPPAAKAVLVERLGEPISKDQWKRIDKVLREHGGDATISHTMAAELRKVWPAAALVAVVALGVARWRWKRLTLAAGLVIVGPTVLCLVAAFAHTHPYLR